MLAAKIIEKDYQNSFQKEFTVYQDHEKLINLNKDIFSIEETLFKQYHTIKV